MRTLLLLVVTAVISATATGWILNVRPAPRLAAIDIPESTVDPSLADVAGAAQRPPVNSLANPLANDRTAVADGHKLYEQMNCAGCHGYHGEGGMGPNLTDTYWRYGGTPVLIYQSIADGRAQGMPQWWPALPRSSIWQLVSFIQSLGGASPNNALGASAAQSAQLRSDEAPDEP